MKILVICTGNSCRSQMAEAFFNQEEGVSAKSAGTHPEKVNSFAISVMREVDIDISGNRSNHIDDFSGESFDYVLTVCDNAAQVCPVFPGGEQKIHHSFEDPAKAVGSDEEALAKFREVRNHIKDYVDDFVRQNM